MGNNLAALNCLCQEEEDEAVLERTEALQKGATFVKSTMMGMSSQKLHVCLSETASSVRWRVEKDSKSWLPGSGQAEYGEIDLRDVDKVKAHGKQSLQMLASKDQSVLFDVAAEDVATRDAWVLGLTEILSKWSEEPGSKPLSVALRATATSDKSAYYEKREADLKAREALRQEKKMKYLKSGANMKYTAQAMINRPANQT
jgi:hypothetical protein